MPAQAQPIKLLAPAAMLQDKGVLDLASNLRRR
jgi:hypothetical protein